MTNREIDKEHRYEKFIGVLIALTTIFAAMTTFLENLSSNEADRFERLAQEYSIRATTESLNGAIRFSYDWQGAFQTWRELDLMITSAEEVGDTARADMFRATRDQLTSLSPLLQEPYFDRASEWTSPSQYEADLYIVESTILWEEFENKSSVANAWDQIANTFVLQLTLYAVVLSLYGLSTTISNYVRWIFVGLGALISIINLFWGAWMFFIPIDEIPETAIRSYAQGFGLAYQGRDAEAIQAFDQALSENPDYANALYNRGFSRLNINNLEGAAQDFEATLAAGRDDTTVLWNLGWTYYLMGRFEDAIAINQIALQKNPTLIGVRTNQALSLLSQGRISNADAEYQLALDEATRQVSESRTAGLEASSSLWYYLDAASADLESLVDIISGTKAPWTIGPDNAMIMAERNQIRQFAVEQIKEIKEYTLALEFFGRPPEGTENVTVSPFRFVQEVLDENGDFVEYVDSVNNSFGTKEIGVLFDFSGFKDGQHEVWKIYVNGVEDIPLRVESDWSVGENGSAIKFIEYAFSNNFVFARGEYVVELYLDSRLVQSGTFYVNDN